MVILATEIAAGIYAAMHSQAVISFHPMPLIELWFSVRKRFQRDSSIQSEDV
jgi:hypothetical protein